MISMISVVVAAKNEEKFIEKCLRALKSQTKKCEIIVVDGHSTDRTRDIAKKYARVVLDNKKGISDARNVGARAVKGDIVAYCDADSIPDKDWIENIEKLMKDCIGLYGPIVLYDGSLKTKLGIRFLNRLAQLSHMFGTPCMCGANMAFRKSFIIKYKFDEKMIILEDYDIGNRLKKYGKIKYSRKLSMPISSRRYENDLFYVLFHQYIKNFRKYKKGEQIDPSDYWTRIDKT